MSRAPSDFRAGVEAAAKWLRQQDSEEWTVLGSVVFGDLSKRMIADLDLDPEGTEARTVTQIVQYLREMAKAADLDEYAVALEGAAADIEIGQWKQS